MIVQIEDARGSCRSALDYNEKKLLMGVATLVGYANLECTDSDYIYDTFERMERTPYLIRCMSFHASVNPSEEDTCTEEQILGFIKGMMESLGYAEQPYLVYRHNDIEREHYHVVSIRVDKNGKKINDYRNYRKLNAYMKSVADKYGFTMAQKGSTTKSLTTDENPPRVKRFNPAKGVTEQLRLIIKQSLEYDFATFNQYSSVLENYGIQAFTLLNGEGKPEIYLRGLDGKGNHATEAFSEHSLGVGLQSMLVQRINETKPLHSRKKNEKERVKNIVQYAVGYAKSEEHFRAILSNKGITVHFSYKEGTKEVLGITVVDHVTKTVFKASELDGVITSQMVNEAIDSGRWANGTKKEVKTSRRAAEAFRRELRSSRMGAVVNLLKPAAAPQNTVWGGKSNDTLRKEAQEEEKRKSGMSFS